MNNRANRLTEAIAMFSSGRLEDAVARLEEVLKDEPFNPLAVHFLGLCNHRQGKREAALQLLLKSVELAPSTSAFHSNLGLFLADINQLDRAVQSFATAIQIDPQSAETYNNLGTVLRRKGQIGEAIENFNLALRINPNFCEALNNLASALAIDGRTQEALDAFEKAIRISPAVAEIYINAGNLYLAERNADRAMEKFSQALRIKPDYVDAMIGMAKALTAKGDSVAALEQLRRVLENDPSNAKAYFEIGNLLKADGQIEGALGSYEKAATLDPTHFYAQWNACFTLPVIYRYPEEIASYRERWRVGVKKMAAFVENQVLAGNRLPFAAPHTNFYLHYQGSNDLLEQKEFADVIARLAGGSYPQLAQARPVKRSQRRKRIRVGFVSSFFSLHTIFKLFHGWIKYLNREMFESYCFHLGTDDDKASVHIQNISDCFFSHFRSHDGIVTKIVESDLDILIYPEIGMDPVTQSLAGLRLAPIQCMAWGHPVTSGFRTIDYFLSSELMEVPWADSHYAETLIRLPNLSICYPPPDVGIARIPEEIEVADRSKTRFLCLQSLFKLLPQYDELYPRIALQVPHSEFWFIALESQNVTDLFYRRLSESFSEHNLDPASHIKIFPKMSIGSFFGLVQAADVILDSVGWSGGNTTLEAVCFDKPIVTFPSEMMRSRHSSAILSLMGMVETIAKSLDDYVAISVRLGLDKTWYSEIASSVARSKMRLYNDLTSVRGLEAFILRELAR